MKALTILQPWASLITCGAKQIETRSWATNYRGPLAIHAGGAPVKLDQEFEDICTSVFFYSRYGLFIPRGYIIAVATLADCVKMTDKLIAKQGETVQGQNELLFGNWRAGRFAWMLADVKCIEPIFIKGKQGLWNWNESGIVQ